MATIALYKDKLNSMPNLITGLQSSINSCKGDLFSLSVNTLLVDSSICNMDEVARELRSATDTLEDRVEKLEHFHDSIEDFIQLTVDTDQDVADAVNQSKEDFYETVDILCNAKTIYVIGARSAAVLARFLVFYFNIIICIRII